MITKHTILKIFVIPLGISVLSACATTPPESSQQRATVSNSVLLDKAKQFYDRKDYNSAATLLLPLAESGDAEAQYALGFLYYNGLGVEQNFKQSYAWIEKSAANGNKLASIALAQLKPLTKAAEKGVTIIPEVSGPGASLESTPVDTPQTAPMPVIPEKSETGEKKIDTSASRPPAEPIVKAPEAMSSDATFPPAYVLEPSSVEDAPGSESSVGTLSMEPVKKPVKNTAPTDTTSYTPLEEYLKISKQWILEQPSENYTVQIASTDRDRFVLTYRDKNPLGKIYYFKNPLGDSVWHSLIIGSYPTVQAAREMLHKARDQEFSAPWIRNIKEIQEIVKKQD